MPETKNVSGEYKLRVNGTTCLHVTPDGINGALGATTPAAITGTTVTANTEFRGTVLTSNAASDVDIKTSGGTQFKFVHIASAVNFMAAYGGATGNGVTFETAGSDANVSVRMYSKARAPIQFYTGAGVDGPLQLQIGDTASAVEYLQITGAASGGSPTLSAQGSSTNIPVTVANKGTAVTKLTGQTTQTTVGAAGGASALPATPTGYLLLGVNGTDFAIPYYAAA